MVRYPRHVMHHAFEDIARLGDPPQPAHAGDRRDPTALRRTAAHRRGSRRCGDESPSLHALFKAISRLTPIEYEKQLRLHETRHLMLTGGASAGNAGFAVGYESPFQFSREYRQGFQAPPSHDILKAEAWSRTPPGYCSFRARRPHRRRPAYLALELRLPLFQSSGLEGFRCPQ